MYYLNGEFQGKVSVIDRGLAYGHGLFETIRLSAGDLPLWNYHCVRLKNGAARLGLVINEKLLEQFRDQLLDTCPKDGVIKIIVTAGSGGRGYRSDSDLMPNYLFQWFPLPNNPSANGERGVSLKLCDYALSSTPKLAGTKHLNRLEQVLARAEWENEYPEGLMLDQQGNVIEGVSSNLFCCQDGHWLTPSLDQCGVAGVMRQYLLDELFPSLSIAVSEVTMSFDELLLMEQLFVCNSVVGIWPVVAIENYATWALGEETTHIQNQLRQALPCYA